jgi:hypothetical protein
VPAIAPAADANAGPGETSVSPSTLRPAVVAPFQGPAAMGPAPRPTFHNAAPKPSHTKTRVDDGF